MHTHAHPMHTQTHTYTPHACVHIPHTHTHTAAHTAPTSPQRPTHPRGLMCPHPHTPHPHTGAMAAACTDHLLSWLPTTESPGPPPPVPPLPHVFLCVWICTRSPSPRTPPPTPRCHPRSWDHIPSIVVTPIPTRIRATLIPWGLWGHSVPGTNHNNGGGGLGGSGGGRAREMCAPGCSQSAPLWGGGVAGLAAVSYLLTSHG